MLAGEVNRRTNAGLAPEPRTCLHGQKQVCMTGTRVLPGRPCTRALGSIGFKPTKGNSMWLRSTWGTWREETRVEFLAEVLNASSLRVQSQALQSHARSQLPKRASGIWCLETLEVLVAGIVCPVVVSAQTQTRRTSPWLCAHRVGELRVESGRNGDGRLHTAEVVFWVVMKAPHGWYHGPS